MAEKTSRRGLNPASIYEAMFKTRHRRSGRPALGEPGGDGETLFPSGGAHPLLVRVAERRAVAVVHEEQRSRLNEVFRKELAVLARRGVQEVAEDIGYKGDLDKVRN